MLLLLLPPAYCSLRVRLLHSAPMSLDNTSTGSEGTAALRSSTNVEASEDATPKPESQQETVQRKREHGGTMDFGFLPIPKSLQYDTERAFEFTTVLNVTFGLASTFSEFLKNNSYIRSSCC